jgi:hypothetical protein
MGLDYKVGRLRTFRYVMSYGSVQRQTLRVVLVGGCGRLPLLFLL